jgi:thioredoxin-related protein
MIAAAAASFAAGIPLALDLAQAGRQAERSCVPLLLEFAADDCDYCTLLEEEVLNPTLLNREYEQRVLMRKLVLYRDSKVHDFSGKPVYASDFANQYKVFVTPTRGAHGWRDHAGILWWLPGSGAGHSPGEIAETNRVSVKPFSPAWT